MKEGNKMKELHSRKSIRLKYYDYSLPGYYFITICTHNREQILSKISAKYVGAGPVSAQQNEEKELRIKNVGAGPVSARTELTYIGNIVEKELLNLGKEFINIKIHDYVIMPNHIHYVIEICKRADTGPAPTIANIICSFKTRTTGLIINAIKNGEIKPFDKKFWQRNYYEHIIRNEQEYLEIKKYIHENPLKWYDDVLYQAE